MISSAGLVRRVVLAASFAAASASSSVRAEPRPSPLGSEASRKLAKPNWMPLLVGIGIEHTQKDIDRFGRGQDLLAGPTVAARFWVFEPHIELLLTPLAGTHEKWRGLANVGLRTNFDVPVLRDLSLGVAVHAEARLEDHFGLLSFTPIEMGTTLFRRGSLDVRLFLGARAAFTGSLIDSYLIDPNGFRDEEARAALHDTTVQTPWRGFARLVFERRVR